MKASEYINELQKIIDEHGDLEVETEFPWGDRSSASAPRHAYRLVLTPRQTKPRFWSKYEGESRRGDAVIRV